MNFTIIHQHSHLLMIFPSCFPFLTPEKKWVQLGPSRLPVGPRPIGRWRCSIARHGASGIIWHLDGAVWIWQVVCKAVYCNGLTICNYFNVWCTLSCKYRWHKVPDLNSLNHRYADGRDVEKYGKVGRSINQSKVGPVYRDPEVIFCSFFSRVILGYTRYFYQYFFRDILDWHGLILVPCDSPPIRHMERHGKCLHPTDLSHDKPHFVMFFRWLNRCFHWVYCY